ncbi:putative DNA-binding transcriptional regulator YafY [Amycolatopsis lexingtonensis]|uniref:DNA-binding transcriptional regulator YafY n=1 Tax=Amycolatopsis lexingtonensis TaxID=218822 RepID=A0ABR9HS69_9PSEU|nr:YafY family protein [Amycolatopsis lexingtonensis]MBE1493778.1 putative DNA-binding transcriptional regulator YafY [Amycolatopsis lexingtonensis]
MLQTSARLLRLLSLLETRRDWTGADLAERLGVSARTVRTDVGKLRELGYPVEAAPGVQGGYRLGAGAQLPPLLLDDDEAVAVAVGLRTATGVSGIAETSVRALAKLEQVLPSRLRHRVQALEAATVSVPGAGPAVAAGVLTAISAAIRASERLRFDYTGHHGEASRREVEPHRLVSWGRRWYLVAWDPARDDWRTFRVDRLTPKVPNGPRFAPREPPEGDVAQFVQRSAGAATWRFHARVRLHAPVAHVRARLPIAVDVTPEGPDRCVAEVGSDNAATLGLYLGLLEVDFEVLDAPELAAELAKTGERFLRAASAGSRPAPG